LARSGQAPGDDADGHEPLAPPTRGAKQRLARILPARIVDRIDGFVYGFRRGRIRIVQRAFGMLGYNIVKKADYYSPLPVLGELEATRERWNRPSALVGIDVDIPGMQGRLSALTERWETEYQAVTGSWQSNSERGFGPGYPQFDARTLYFMLREHRPAHYLEVGSGLSTYYATVAARQNGQEGAPMQITCVEPYPFRALQDLPGVDLVVDLVQEVPLDRFTALEAGDVLFIDSSHALKIDSDVAYLFLEVLPRLAPGVLVHIHDVPFPYNVPFPADFWLFGERWPVYWNEAMVVQSFLTFNTGFEILLSTPMLRHHDEAALEATFPDYVPVADDANPPSSLWVRRTDR
jgi:hypothetical protein